MIKRKAWSFQISDLMQWYAQDQISFSPKYQRGKVWNDNARSYLIDTIIRGLPIPPVFIRQKVDITTKTTFREVIDGQQRIRTITEYISDSFYIKKSHNKEFGGKYFSDLDTDTQEEILSYQISVELVTEKDDSIIYDMFARLNSNNIILNRQEIRNAKYWGDFKVLVYRLASEYRDFFLEQKLFNDRDCGRMKDVEFVSSLLIVIIDGIVEETATYVDNIYNKYDAEIPKEDQLEEKFEKLMNLLKQIYDFFNSNSGCFGNKNYFFTLYCVLYNQMFGIPGLKMKRKKEYDETSIKDSKNLNKLFSSLSQFINDFDANISDKKNLLGKYVDFSDFEKNHKLRTTNRTERLSRITFLNDTLLKY